ncbi:NPC intracellular cholesterol transporter 2-like [Parasteatoda tepidariorum]|uniref:NPC intracellular cholesterol transporter 2-like n=1 Tax=Parasteatoda tepidariorum TaxID=114398 RepID=UPI00077F8653|nr:NPC intracellular cholesterol transporter 2-like [Parasteatoda tepidariorum]
MTFLLEHLILMTLVVLSLSANIEDCGSKNGIVRNVSVSGCSASDTRCRLPRGTAVNITVEFESEVDSRSVTAQAYGTAFGVPLPLRVKHEDVCRNDISCPIKDGETYIDRNAINIPSLAPRIRTNVVYELRDQMQNRIVCVEIPSVFI